MGDDDHGRRERALRDRAAAGDALAWRALFDSAYGRVHAYVSWRLGGRTDGIEDIVQEAWLVAARRLATFDPAIGRFAEWVCGIAAHVVRRHWRTHSRRQSRVRPLGHTERLVVTVEEDDTANRVAAALASLPDRYERVLRAKYFDQWSVNAIAAHWGETPKAIESLLSRARHAFRQAFEAEKAP